VPPMADRTALEIELELMVDIAAGRVEDDANAVPRLLVEGEWMPIPDLVWALYRAGLATLPEGSRRWQLTGAGEQALKEADGRA